MAGHSHWAQIKHKKAIIDAKRSQLISKLIRAITIAAKEGNNPETTYKLRAAIERAKEFQVSLDTIEKAIKKGESKENNLEEIIFEAYLGDVQLLIKTITDNKNRTIGDLRHLLNRFGGRLAEPGSVIWNFQEKGTIIIDKQYEDKIIDFVDLIEDIKIKNNNLLLITKVSDLHNLKNKLESQNIPILDSFIDFIPINTIEILDENLKSKIKDLIEELLNLDDVDEVFLNIKE
jgi:YebC/PmpR family DNA-binding regulatory protein